MVNLSLKNKFMDFIIKFSLPMILNTVIMSTIFDAYQHSNENFTVVLYFLYQLVLFRVFELLKPRKIIRGLIYTVMLGIIIFLTLQLLSAGWQESQKSFIDWFYINSQTVGQIDQYFYMMFFCFGFFMTSIIYYFTVIRYRTAGTMLAILFPFVIYGKRDDDMSYFSMTLMMTLFIALYVHEKQISDDVIHNTKINISYTAATALFVTFVGAIAMILPNPQIKSQLERNNEFFNFFKVNNSTVFDNFSDKSSPRFGADSTGEILFYVKSMSGNSKLYLRREFYDDFRRDGWVRNAEQNYVSNVYSSVNDPAYIYEMMKNIVDKDEEFASQYGLSKELFEDYTVYNVRDELSYYSEDFYPRYVPSMLMMEQPVNNQEIYMDSRGRFNRNNFRMPLNGTYSYTIESAKEYAYANSLSLNSDNFRKFIDAAYGRGLISYEDADYILKLYNGFLKVDETQVDKQRIKALADSIVKDCKNDYQKAKAIVDYFEQSGYNYDLDYIPDDESIEYFLFNSKIGSCSSYATAMTLMMRLEGLPARYVEGFAAYEPAKKYQGFLTVRDSHAHAFVEVFIAGAGWQTFDPTVPGYEDAAAIADDDDQMNINTKLIGKFFSYFSRIILFLGVLFVIFFVLLIDYILEEVFRIRLHFCDNKEKVLRIYRRMIKLYENSEKKRMRGYTPNEITGFGIDFRNVDMTSLAELFQKVCFGGYQPNDNETDEVYKQYKQAWKSMVKVPDKKKK